MPTAKPPLTSAKSRELAPASFVGSFRYLSPRIAPADRKKRPVPIIEMYLLTMSSGTLGWSATRPLTSATLASVPVSTSLRPSVSVAAPRIGATMISVAAEAEPMYASVLVAFAVPSASTMNGAAVSAVTARLRT